MSRPHHRLTSILVLVSLVPGSGAAQVVSAQSSGTPTADPPPGLLSEDGWIVWQSDALRVASLDGSESRALLPPGLPRSAHADWSPDGERLAFIRDEPDGTADIRVVARDGTGDTLLVDCVAPCLFAEEPAWSPDGTRIAYWMGDDVRQVIRVADATTGETLIEIPSPDPLMGPITPRWSPDGTKLTTHAEVYEQHGDDYVLVDGRIGVADLTAASPTFELITPAGLKAMYPDWSPDGSRILFVAGNVDPFFGTGDPNDLYTVAPEGSDLVRLTDRPRGAPRLGTPTWTAGGEIVLTLIDSGSFTLGAVEGDGTGLHQLLLHGSPIPGAHPRVWVEP